MHVIVLYCFCEPTQAYLEFLNGHPNPPHPGADAPPPPPPQPQPPPGTEIPVMQFPAPQQPHGTPVQGVYVCVCKMTIFARTCCADYILLYLSLSFKTLHFLCIINSPVKFIINSHPPSLPPSFLSLSSSHPPSLSPPQQVVVWSTLTILHQVVYSSQP